MFSVSLQNASNFIASSSSSSSSAEYYQNPSYEESSYYSNNFYGMDGLPSKINETIIGLNTSSLLDQPNRNHKHDKTSNCSANIHFLEIESYCYLFIMCPLALIGIILNIICLKVFQDKSFASLTFKYLRLITGTDLFICIIVIPYCLTAYTQPWNTYDWYARHFYLVYVYIPGANFAINLSTFLNLLVTIERLVSVGWPVKKHIWFKPSRYLLSVIIVILMAVLFNILNFFLYEIVFCKSILIPRSFTMQRWWSFYGYAKEIITRILPIILLVIANIILICIVRNSRNRMKKNRDTRSKSQTLPINIQVNNNEDIELGDKDNAKNDRRKSIDKKKESNDKERKVAERKSLVDVRKSLFDIRKSIDANANTALIKKSAANKNRQENQLTTMTICVAVLYLVSSIPMVFAYPGIVFTAEQTQSKFYKMYAALVNILELLQCSFRFLIYFCFTTQFRVKFYQLNGMKNKKPNTELSS